jgi:putative transposase
MDEFESLSHSKWECKYHVVFIPKYRRKALYGELRKYLGEIFWKLAERRESRVEEGHLLPDHVHMMLSIPPKYAVSQVVDTSKARARFTWRGFMARRSEASQAGIFGHADTSSRP